MTLHKMAFDKINWLWCLKDDDCEDDVGDEETTHEAEGIKHEVGPGGAHEDDPMVIDIIEYAPPINVGPPLSHFEPLRLSWMDVVTAEHIVDLSY